MKPNIKRQPPKTKTPNILMILGVVLSWAAAPSSATILSDGHVDGIGIGYSGGAWDLHIHDEETGSEYEPDEAVLRVLEAAETTVPSDPNFAFLGSGGDPVWVLPQDGASADALGVLFLGIASEEVAPGTFTSDIRVSLANVTFTPEPGVSGTGHFSVFTTDTFGVPTVYLDSGDGISPADFLEIPEDSHEHFNWAFTKPGFYELRIVTSATQGVTPTSGTASFFFRVRSEDAPFTASYNSGEHRISGTLALTFTEIGTPDIAEDGALAYTARLAGAGVTNANNAGVVLDAGETKGIPYRKGDAAPGIPAAVFRSFGSPVITASGSHRLLAFPASLAQGPGGVTKATAPVLVAEFVDGGDQIAAEIPWRAGNAAPGLAGFQFTSLLWWIACDEGTVYFASAAKDPSGTRRGVWARKVSGGVPQTTLLIATGSPFLTDLGVKTVRSISSPAETGAARNQHRAASLSGHLALRVNFTDGTTQIITFKP